MAVFRVEHNKNYTVMSNYHLRDKNLSLKAKGLLSICLSLREDWDYSVNGLVAITREGRTAIMSALKELENAGYIRRSQVRDKNGRMGKIEYTIYEFPQQTPRSENPTSVIATSENPQQLNTINKLNTYKLNTECVCEATQENPAAEETLRAEENTPTPACCGGFKNVHLTEEELAMLKEKLPDDYEELIERLSEYKESTGKEYKSDYATILHWSRDSERAGGKKIPKYGDPDYYAYEEGEGLCFSN